MKMTKLLSALAAAGIAIAPFAVQAGTSASLATPKLTNAASGDASARRAAKVAKKTGVAPAAIVGGAVAASKSNDAVSLGV